MTPTTRLLVAVPFTATIYSERHEGDFDVDCEVTGSVSLNRNGDEYTLALREVLVGATVYRPPMVSPRLAAQAEEALIAAFESAEAAERRAQSVADEVRTIAGLGAR